MENAIEVPAGTKIGILSDCHGMVEPLRAALEDMKKKGITMIFSLGDNIGVGPNPKEVMDLLEEYGVISVAGNAEDYVVFGPESFPYIMRDKRHGGSRVDDIDWTRNKLTPEQLDRIKKYPRSIDLIIGGKRVALCHFFTDVRTARKEYGVFAYQKNFDIETGERVSDGVDFDSYVNSDEEKKHHLYLIRKSNDKWYKDHPNTLDNPFTRGLRDALDKPLFGGKKIHVYDAIFQGHVHFKLCDRGSTTIHSIRAVGMGDVDVSSDKVSYVIVTAKEDGYDVEEVTDVSYDRKSLIRSILDSDNNSSLARKYVGIDESGMPIKK